MISAINPSPSRGYASIAVRLVGGPTALFGIGGLQLLTDPTFDPPGDHPIGKRNLIKTTNPAVAVDEIGDVNVVLLSHDQHPDNLDSEGRKFIENVPLVLTTSAAAERLGATARELPIWTSYVLARPDGGQLKITGRRNTVRSGPSTSPAKFADSYFPETVCPLSISVVTMHRLRLFRTSRITLVRLT
jgi:L-ascorbate metabolism protein UlaG (beta-lactamase superfamily)